MSLDRKVLLLIDLPLLTESLVMRGRVKLTEAYHRYINNVSNKLAEVDEDFFLSPAMNQSVWKDANYDKRHLVCRLSAHGFHHKVCFLNCKEVSNACLCKFCFQQCHSLLHVLNCSYLKNKSLSFIDTL